MTKELEISLSTARKIWKHKVIVFFSSVGAFSFIVLESYYVGFTELESIFASTYFQSLIMLGIIGSIANYGIHYFTSKRAPPTVVLTDKQIDMITLQISQKQAASDEIRDTKVKTALDADASKVKDALDARESIIDARDEQTIES